MSIEHVRGAEWSSHQSTHTNNNTFYICNVTHLIDGDEAGFLYRRFGIVESCPVNPIIFLHHIKIKNYY